jgi:hypothetical protein
VFPLEKLTLERVTLLTIFLVKTGKSLPAKGLNLTIKPLLMFLLVTTEKFGLLLVVMFTQETEISLLAKVGNLLMVAR